MFNQGSNSFFNSALNVTPVLVYSRQCHLAGYHLLNPGASAAYIQFFDAAAIADVTVGTTTPKFSLGLPATGGAARTCSFPIRFVKGVVIACTSTATGSGAPNAANIAMLEFINS